MPDFLLSILFWIKSNSFGQRRRTLLLLFWILPLLGSTQSQHYGALRNGDILFQDLDCGELCDAIEHVTQSYGKRHFSHIGLVYKRGDSVFVIEAIGSEVQLTPLQRFVGRNDNEILLGRVRSPYRKLADRAVDFAIKQLHQPYDDAFLYNNNKYYCSELIYEAFKFANNEQPFFELSPMTFKQPNSDDYFPVWQRYYSDLKMAIPEGMAGINPGGISRSSKLRMYLYKVVRK